MTTAPINLLDAIAGYARHQAAGGSASKPIRLATVDPAFDLDDGYLPKVTFDGETTLSGQRYPYGAGYVPAAGDRVVMVPVGTTYWIVGSVSNSGRQGFQSDPANDLYVTWFGPDSYVSVDNGAAVLVLGGNSVHPNSKELVSGLASVNHNTTSSTYADLASPSSGSFTKRESGTQIRIDMHGTVEQSGTNSEVVFGVRINGADYDVATRHINPTNQRESWGGVKHISGIPAGTYTIQARWKRVSGTATINRYANDDWMSMAAMEVDG